MTINFVPNFLMIALAMDSVSPVASRKQPSSCPPRKMGNIEVMELATPPR